MRRGLFGTFFIIKLAETKLGWGGARPGTGGSRPNTGGARTNSGRKRRAVLVASDVSEMRWFVYRTFPQAEEMSVRDLLRTGWNAYMPMVEEYRIDPVMPTMKHIVATPFWRGYGCVEFDRTSRVWPTILQCDGVRAVMGDKWGRPFPVARGWIERIQSEADARCIVRKIVLPLIEDGTPMQVMDGAFTDHTGVCIWSDQKRVKILTPMLGGLREITIDRTQVRSLA